MLEMGGICGELRGIENSGISYIKTGEILQAADIQKNDDKKVSEYVVRELNDLITELEHKLLRNGTISSRTN